MALGKHGGRFLKTSSSSQFQILLLIDSWIIPNHRQRLHLTLQKSTTTRRYLLPLLIQISFFPNQLMMAIKIRQNESIIFHDDGFIILINIRTSLSLRSDVYVKSIQYFHLGGP